MTYLKDGIEYLYEDEQTVYDAIKAINAAGRTTNNSQIARYTGMSNGRVATVVTELRSRGFIKNVSRGAAYHWRIGTQPVPYPVADRNREDKMARRQRELNEQIRAQAAAPTSWEVKTFDGQRMVGIGNFDDEQVARSIARGHREHGFTTRVRATTVYSS